MLVAVSHHQAASVGLTKVPASGHPASGPPPYLVVFGGVLLLLVVLVLLLYTASRVGSVVAIVVGVVEVLPVLSRGL